MEELILVCVPVSLALGFVVVIDALLCSLGHVNVLLNMVFCPTNPEGIIQTVLNLSFSPSVYISFFLSHARSLSLNSVQNALPAGMFRLNNVAKSSPQSMDIR